jgi:hypothetical protein
MLPDVFCMLMCFFSDAGCLMLSETGGLVFLVSSVARNCCLDEVSFLIVLLGYLGGHFVGLDAAVRMSRQ